MKRSMMGEKKYPANPWLYLPLAMDTEDQSGNHRSVITRDISFKNNYAVFNGRSTYLDTGYVIKPSIRACTIVFWMKIQELYSGFTYIMASLLAILYVWYLYRFQTVNKELGLWRCDV